MNFDNQPTIRALPSVNVGEISEGTTPAIAAFMKAFQQGTIDADAIQSAFRSGVENVSKLSATQKQVQQDKLDKQIAPLIAKRKALEEQSAIDVNPSKTTAAIKANEVSAKTSDFLGTKISSEAETQRLNEIETQEARDARADGSGEEILKRYKALGKGVIRNYAGDGGGSLDIDKMEAELKNSTASAQNSKLYQNAAEMGVNPKDAQGNWKPEGVLLSEMAVASQKKVLTPVQKGEELASIGAAESTLGDMKNAAESLFELNPDGTMKKDAQGNAIEKSHNITGPLIGTWVGQLWNKVYSVVDGKSFVDQQALKRLHSNLTRDLASSLKGPLSEKELKFLQESLPNITDDETTWQKYLERFIPIMASNIKRRKEALTTGAAPTAGAPAAPAAPEATSGPTGWIDPSSPDYATKSASAVQVSTPADLSKLKPGMFYWHRGKLWPY